jgi:hypothetical protein
MSVARMRDELSNVEYRQWRAFYVWRHAMQELAAKESRKL